MSLFEGVKARHEARVEAYNARAKRISQILAKSSNMEALLNSDYASLIYQSLGLLAGPYPTLAGSLFKNPKIQKFVDIVAFVPAHPFESGGIAIGARSVAQKQAHRR